MDRAELREISRSLQAKRDAGYEAEQQLADLLVNQTQEIRNDHPDGNLHSAVHAAAIRLDIGTEVAMGLYESATGTNPYTGLRDDV